MPTTGFKDKTDSLTLEHRSFRLPRWLLAQLKRAAERRQTSQTGLVQRYLDEGLKMDSYPMIVFRDSSLGRRAMLEGTRLDVAQVIETIRNENGSVEVAADYAQDEVVIGFSQSEVQRVVVRRIPGTYAWRRQRQGLASDDHRRVEARRIGAFLRIHRMMQTKVAPSACVVELRHLGFEFSDPRRQIADRVGVACWRRLNGICRHVGGAKTNGWRGIFRSAWTVS